MSVASRSTHSSLPNVVFKLYIIFKFGNGGNSLQAARVPTVVCDLLLLDQDILAFQGDGKIQLTDLNHVLLTIYRRTA